jgi:hypothetical protein
MDVLRALGFSETDLLSSTFDLRIMSLRIRGSPLCATNCQRGCSKMYQPTFSRWVRYTFSSTYPDGPSFKNGVTTHPRVKLHRQS